LVSDQTEKEGHKCEPFLYRGSVDKNGQMKGYGQVIYKNGMKYIGRVNSNNISAFGTMIYPNGFKLEGRHGENGFNILGKMTRPHTKEVIYGYWKTLEGRQFEVEAVDDWLVCIK
jgi:hypothetical protein